MRGPVAFLFLGETLLIPHLYPIVEALAREPDVAIDLWASTSIHETLLDRWTRPLGNPNLRIRRAPGFRRIDADTASPSLPAKLPMLVRLAPRLLGAPIAVCAEQTSLWLPRLLPMPTRFVKTAHGAGSMMARADHRRRAAALTLVPAERERQALIDHGLDPATIVATGYVKAAFAHRTHARPPFAGDRPVILYAPHWQRHRSSWWRWGPAAVHALIEDGRYDLVFAPHQRLAEEAPEIRALIAAIAQRPHVHCDIDSFATVDGSYTAAADIYLGDTSSQIVEFLTRPRPCVFLNAGAAAWRGDPAYAMWGCGEVIEAIEDLLPALERAPIEHRRFAATQRDFTASSLGDTSGAAPDRAAREILALLDRR